MEIVIEELQAHQRIPSGIAFGESVRLAGEGIEPIMQDARLSHTLIVSYLCPVISSAARKLPRRITINKACATSEAFVFRPYMGVPCVSPK